LEALAYWQTCALWNLQPFAPARTYRAAISNSFSSLIQQLEAHDPITFTLNDQYIANIGNSSVGKSSVASPLRSLVRCGMIIGKIRVRVSGNPKRSGTDAYERFALYRSGMTTREYADAVVRLGYPRAQAASDLHYDKKHRFIRVERRIVPFRKVAPL